VSLKTRAGLLKIKPVRPGSRIGLVAPASPFGRDAFDAGVLELQRLGFEPVFDERVFEKRGFVAGEPERRAAQLTDFWRRADVDALIAVRGGYGSLQLLPFLSLTDAQLARQSRAAFVGYSDVTSVHVWLAACAGMVSIHGPMIDRRLSAGPSAYDPASFLASLSTEPIGELRPEGVEVIKPGEASGPLFGGTLTQLVASLGTPWAFDPPQGHVLFLDEVGERPYRIDRMLVQLQQAGLLARAAGIVFGQLPRCDEPGGTVTGRATVADVLRDFPGPVLCGFPSGHTVTPLVTLPFGVHVQMMTASRSPGLMIVEAAAGEE
jgi:muramoyltetrapeptide carboxypeptidase